MPDSYEITRPYPGLRPFEPWEGEIFFGREEHTNRLLDILKERHFLAVIGPSGSGKSSLVRAGLLPALPLGSLGTGSDWRIAIMRPGNRPLRSLSHALLARSALGIELVGEERIPEDERDMTPEVALIEADLRRGPLGLIDIVQDARTRQTGKDAFNLLVLVDQFEEIFTYSDTGGRQADEAEAFVNLLLATQTVPNAWIYIVLTMRTDFLGNCVRFLELPDAINRTLYLTPRLTREQIERAITSPAYLFNGDIEPTLVTELINSVSNDPDQLPILQHALSRMWSEAIQRQTESPSIAWNDFTTVGGIADALSLHADEILAALSPRNQIDKLLCPEQLAAVDLFRAITEQRSAESGGQVVRSPQSLARIAQWSGRPWQDFKPVIEAYAREGINFLHINSPLNSDTIVDISHEALIRQWPRLRDWVAQEARLASEYQRFRDRTEDFNKGSGVLLTGADLARALEWRDGTFSREPNTDIWQPSVNWAVRYHKNGDIPSSTGFNEVLKFIDSSHAAEIKEKRERVFNRALKWLTAISVTSMIFAVGFAILSYVGQISLQAVSLWSPLDFNYTPITNVTKKQWRGLQKLESADEAPKLEFFDQLFRDPAFAERFIYNPEAIMTAIVGISPTRKNELLHRLDKPLARDSDIVRLARLLSLSELGAKISSNEIMSAIPLNDNDNSSDPEDLIAPTILGQRIKTLIGKMEMDDPVELSNLILNSFNEPTIDSEFELEPRAEALASIIERVPQEKLNIIAGQLITAINKTHTSLQLDTLKQSLVLVAENMQDKQQAGALANQLFNAIKTSLDPVQISAKKGALVPEQIETLGKGFEILAPKIPENLAEDLSEKLIVLIKDSSYTYISFYNAFKTLEQSLASIEEARKGDKQKAGTLGKMQDYQQAGDMAKLLFNTMKESMIPEQFDALGQGLAAIVTKMPISELELLTDQFINAIVIKGEYHSQFNIIGQGLQEDDIARYRTLGNSLTAMLQMMPEKQANTIADTLFSALKKKHLDPGQINALGQGLAEAAAKITQPLADTFAKKLTSALYDLQDATYSSRQFSAFVGGITGIAKQLSEPEAYELAKKFITLIRELEKKQNYIKFDALGEGLAELAAKVSGEKANELTMQIITAIKESEKNRMQTMAFGPGIAKAAANIPTQEIVIESEYLISLFKRSNNTQLKVYVKALEAMVNNIPEDQTLAIADPLIAVINGLIREPKNEDIYISKIKTLGKGLRAVTAKVQETQVEELTGQLIAAINESKDPDKNEALGQGLAAACTKTTSNGAISLADKLIAAMQVSTSPSQFQALGQGLPVVIEKLPEAQRSLAKQLVDIILMTQNISQLQVQGQVFKVITGELNPDDKSIVNWFKLLRNPLTPRNILAAAICQRLLCAPKEKQGVWNLIEWAKQHYPDIDLEAPLKDSALI